MRRAFSAAELTVAALILGAALVPMYQMFVRGSTTATQSRIAYMALHVAREELEEIRQIPLPPPTDPNNPNFLQPHDWERVTGQLFRRSVKARAHAGDNPVLDSKLKYPTEYQRIFTRLGLVDTTPADPRYKRAVLDVKWEETGVGSERSKEAISHFETLVAAHNVERP